MKIGIFRNETGPNDFYRATTPIYKAVDNKAAVSTEIWSANFLYEASLRTKEFMGLMDCDIYLMQRFAANSIIGKVKRFISDLNLKTKIVLDQEDDVFNVSPLSSFYANHGTENIKIINNGSILHEWKDGVNMDIAANRQRIEGLKKAVSMADLVTVTTEELSNVYRKFNPNVAVLPNCVDVKQWKRLDLIRSSPDEIRICWAGGSSHFEDLLIIKDVLAEICDKYRNVKIVMVGYMPKGMAEKFRPEQIEYHEWVDNSAHAYRMAALDIDLAVIPLRDNVFNAGKSPIKWIEFAALKVPAVTSHVGPYKLVADLDSSENGIFIEQNDLSNWSDGISLLIESYEFRKTMGDQARKTVENHFDINKRYPEWISAYENILDKKEVQIGNSIQPSFK